MAEIATGERAVSETAGSTHHPDHPDIDWDGVERSSEFQELVRKRRSFVIPALAFVFVWYFGFIALAGYAPDFMGESIYEGFTIGYALALSQFVMTWFLGWLYLRKADRDFDPLARQVAEQALSRSRPAVEPRAGDGEYAEPRRRFAPHAGEEVRRR
jgi:uncharacterized membrane protein (DUF485 family)